MDNYNRGGHTKYSMKVHLIFVTKYRKKLFACNEMSMDIKQYLYEIAIQNEYHIVQMETDQDHIHILLDYSPKTSVSVIVKQLKQYSTYQMWNHHRNLLLSQYWNHRILWSDGYFACSVGQASQRVIEEYIQNQG